MRLVFWLVFFLLLLLSLEKSEAYIIKYDLFFKRWSEFYFAFEDWRWFKAQGIAESSLNPNAVSWCGAMGIMQLMPLTAKEMGVSNPFDPEENIQGGIKYDRVVYNYFKKIPLQIERRKFMFAGYNAGMGNISRAINLSKSYVWDEVKDYLPLVTGKHAQETINYVAKIHKVKGGLQ